MNKLYLLILSIALGLMPLLLQGQTVRGVLTDAETGELLPWVSVLERGSSNGAISDAEGRYEIPVSSDTATLIFSFIGYQTHEEALGGRTNLNIALRPSSSMLGEVVVTALNLKRERKDLGYAVQTLEGGDLSEVKSPNFVDNLAGRVAGVNVVSGATGVGSTSLITIRGESSFTNNNPLFVVDGTPISNASIVNFTNDAASGFQEVDFGNGGMELNQDDIESVTVLKGPGAAALYGTRAANGVIQVTTKRGSRRQGLGLSYHSTALVEQPFQLPVFQNQYGQGNSGQFAFVDGLGGGVNDNISYSWGPRLDAGLLLPQFDSPVRLPDGRVVRGGDVAVHGGAPIEATPFVSHSNNLRDLYRTGLTTINQVAISSGFSGGSFRISATDLRSQSPIPGVNLDRNTVAAHLEFTPVSRLTVRASANYINSRSDNRPSNGYGSENVNYSLVAWGPRSLNMESLRDYWQPGLEQVQQFSFNYTFFDNPFFILQENRNAFRRDRLFGSLTASYDITEALQLSVWTGMDYSDELRTYRRHFSTNRLLQGAYAEQDVFFREINIMALLNYRKSVGAFSFDLSAGANRMDQQASNRQLETLSLAQPGVFNFSNAASPLQVMQLESHKRINSLFGLAKMNYREILYLDLTLRNDWSSALATPSSAANTSFIYPSASASFLLSRAFSLPNSISFAKLRFSWAAVGNDTDPYQTTTAFVAGTPYNAQPTFTVQNILANAGLLPERTQAWETGFDLRFFEDRLQIDFTYYDALTSNQIISLPVPISSGYSQQVVNGGGVRSRGVEIMLGVSPVRSARLRWNSFLNFSRNVSTVSSLPDGANTITLAYSRVYDNENQTVWFQVEEGGRMGDMYGTGYLRNEQGELVLDANGNYIADNRLKKIGNFNPDFMLGFSNEFRVGNWDASLLLDWRQGGQLVSRTLALAAVGGQLIETQNRPEEGIVAQGVVNTGTPENPVWVPNTTPIPAESYYRQFYDRNHEEHNTYDASFLKLRQVSIGYTFRTDKERGFLQRGRSLRLALVGRNLYAWSEIPHFDPEQLAVQGSRFLAGVEDMSYPSTRSFGCTLAYQF